MPKSTHHARSANETETLGRMIGQHLKGGEVIELISDLGGGKTTITKGIVAGAGSVEHVTSPTFTVTKYYQVAKRANRQLQTIVHADLYRLHDPGLMQHELADLIDDPSVSLIVEWAGIVANVLPDRRVRIELSAPSEHARSITITFPEELAYVVEGIA